MLGVGEGDSFRDVIPLIETVAAATSAGVLRDEDGVPAHRRLLAVIRGKGRRKASPNKLFRMAAKSVHTDPFDIVSILCREMKAGVEGGF